MLQFFLKNNTNLDLSTILNTKNLQLQDLIQSNMSTTPKSKATITISNEDYTRLLELNNQVYQLVEKRNMDIQEFIQKETTTTEELSKINTERQGLIKKLTKEGENYVR